MRRDPLGAEGLITAPIFILPHFDESAIVKRNINERIGLEKSKKMSIMRCICPQCGASYYGWALNDPSERRCEQCGSFLEICGDDDLNKVYNSPLAYPQYKIKNNEISNNYFASN